MAPFTADYRANFSDTDAAGIVHFSTIFFWVEATEEALFRQLKLPFLRTEGTKLTGFPRVRVECDFLFPIYREDIVTVALSPNEIGDKKLDEMVKEYLRANPGMVVEARNRVAARLEETRVAKQNKEKSE